MKAWKLDIDRTTTKAIPFVLPAKIPFQKQKDS